MTNVISVLTINGIVYKNYRSLKFTKERNKLGFMEFLLNRIEPADYTANINYNKKVILEEFDGTNYTRIFKGYIRSVEKISRYRTKVTVYSPVIKLFDRTWSDRQEYVNIATNTIFSAAVNSIMTIGTNGITLPISTRFDLDNRLRSIAQLANIHGGEWWEDEDGLMNDRINLDYSRYSTTSVKTITIGHEYAMATDNIDNEKIFNMITLLGRGDGINQVKAKTYGFCFYTPKLNGAITETSTTISIDDPTGFTSGAGVIYINNEKITYTSRTGTTLFGCSRGASGTEAVAHSDQIRVWYAGAVGSEYTESSPAPGSSVDLYGIREYTHFDKRIVLDIDGDPNESGSQAATILYDKFKDPVRTITLQRRKLNLDGMDVGKTITVVDNQIGLSADFKIYKIEFEDGRGKGKKLQIYVNNVLHDFSNDLDELKKNMDTSNTYGQGATNIYQVNNSENVDSTHPMNLRFYMPPEAVAVNTIKLNFKMLNYRADSQSVNVAPNFAQNSAVWNSSARAFNIGNPTYNSAIDTLDVTDRDFLISATPLYQGGFVSHTGTLFTFNPEILVDTVLPDSSDPGEDNIHLRFNLNGNYDLIASTGTWSTNMIVRDMFTNKSSGVESVIAGSYVGVIELAFNNPWFTGSVYATATAPNISGTFDKIKISGTIFNGVNQTRNPTIYLERFDGGWTILATYTPTLFSDSLGSGTVDSYFFIDYEDTADNRNKRYRIRTPVDSSPSGWDINNETRSDVSYIFINVATYIQENAPLDYGIYENTSEFTPPGEVTIEVGPDGGPFTFVGTYTSDQTNITLHNIIDFEKDNYYVIRMTPTAFSYGGRMRIEAIAYIQIYIESKTV